MYDSVEFQLVAPTGLITSMATRLPPWYTVHYNIRSMGRDFEYRTNLCPEGWNTVHENITVYYINIVLGAGDKLR